MNNPQPPSLTPGTPLRVHQKIRQQDRWIELVVEGELVSFTRKPTGSWFAHDKHLRLWLDRLTVRKADGSLSELVIDAQSEIETLDR